MLLIYPPVAKPGEPPAGIARLAGMLKAHGAGCTLLDANIEGLYYLAGLDQHPGDTWTRRALKHRTANLEALSAKELYQNRARYHQVVRELNRVIEQSTDKPGLSLSLVNYQDASLSPVRSSDLHTAATEFEENLYFPYFKTRLTELIGEGENNLVGFSLNYLSQANTTFAMIGFLRKHFPQVEIIVGGGLATSWASQPEWSNPFSSLVDHWTAGPGERPLLKLLGLKLTRTAPPDYTDLPLAKYLSPGLTLPYAASSGCYWNKCSFCPEKAEGSRYTTMQPETVSQELQQLCEHHRPALLHLLDNAISPALMRTFVANPPQAPWYGFARVDEQLTDPAFCASLRASGCVMLKLGLESGNQQVLDAMQKGISLELVSKALRALEHAGIATYVYLLFGTPSEARQEALDTLHFTVKHQSSITFLNLAVFNMPLFGDDARNMQVATFYEGDLSLYCNFQHPSGWNRSDIRTFLDKEFKRHPAIAPILRRDPPFFTSNHAPFFHPDFPFLKHAKTP